MKILVVAVITPGMATSKDKVDRLIKANLALET